MEKYKSVFKENKKNLKEEISERILEYQIVYKTDGDMCTFQLLNGMEDEIFDPMTLEIDDFDYFLQKFVANYEKLTNEFKRNSKKNLVKTLAK